MKRLLIEGQEVMEAEKIVVDKAKGTIIGYTNGQEVFALRGVDFAKLVYSVEGGEDVPEPTLEDRMKATEDAVNFLLGL